MENIDRNRKSRAANSLINAEPKERSRAERYGQVWSTTELGQDFEVIGFLAPYVGVRRKSDGVRGSLLFQHLPRFYFRFLPE